MKYLVTWKLLPVPPEMAKTALALIEATEAWIEAEKKAEVPKKRTGKS